MLPPSDHEQKKRIWKARLFGILVAVLLTTICVVLRNGTDQPGAVFMGVAAMVGLIWTFGQ